MKTFKKRLNNRGFSHVELFVAVVVVLVVAGAGFYVYKHQNKAHAENWSSPFATSPSGVKISACKTYINAYGGVNNVSILFTKPAGAPNYQYAAQVIRNNNTNSPVSSTTGTSYWAKTAGQLRVNQSVYFKDNVNIQVNGNNGIGTQLNADYINKYLPSC